jgi:hypothetical protein
LTLSRCRGSGDDQVQYLQRNNKTAADGARLFKIHSATVSRLLAQPYANTACKNYAR